jgi:DNA-binding transcriptional ArsR family regulator
MNAHGTMGLTPRRCSRRSATTDRPGPEPLSESAARGVVRLCRALGEPTRLRLFRLLATQPRSVGSDAYALAISTAAASRHLSRLADAGLIRRMRSGLFQECRLTPAGSFALRSLAAVAAAAEEFVADPGRQEAATDLTVRSPEDMSCMSVEDAVFWIGMACTGYTISGFSSVSLHHRRYR